MQRWVLWACVLLIPTMDSDGFLHKFSGPKKKTEPPPAGQRSQPAPSKALPGDSSRSAPALEGPGPGVARVPSMGFNSHDSYDWKMDEEELFRTAEAMRDRLLPFGYNTLTLDWFWYRDGRAGQRCAAAVASEGDPAMPPTPGCLLRKGHPTNRTHQLYHDDNGRFYPDPIRFPSTAKTKSWKPIVERLAAMGISLGLHLMPGVTRFAVDAGLSVAGMPEVPIADIVDVSRSPRGGVICNNCNFYLLDMNKRGAQQWYDAAIRQLADSGVRYLKLDFTPAEVDSDNIKAIAAAIKKTGAPIEFSVHGVSSAKAAAKIGPFCNSYRIANDVHDNWHSVEVGLATSQLYAGHGLEGAAGLNGFSWPDHGTLALGLQKPKGTPRGNTAPSANLLSLDEQQFLMTLWGITRSPLFYGGRADNMSAATVALLTNPDIIALNRDATAAPWPVRTGPPAFGWGVGAGATSRSRRFAGLGFALEFCDPNDVRQRWNVSRLSAADTFGGASQEGEEEFAGTSSDDAVQLHFDFSNQNAAAQNVCARLGVWSHNCSNSGLAKIDLMDCRVNHCDGRSILWKLPAAAAGGAGGGRRGQIVSDLTGACLTGNPQSLKSHSPIAVAPCREGARGQTWLVQALTAAPEGERTAGLVTIEETGSGRCLSESLPLTHSNTWVGQVGDVVYVAFFNTGPKPASMGASFEELRLGKRKCFAANVWQAEDLGLMDLAVNIPAIPSHGVALVKLHGCARSE